MVYNVTNEQILKAVEGLGDKVDTINGRVRENETAIAALAQWKVGQDKVVDRLGSDVKRIRDKTNLWQSMLSLGELAIAGVLAVLFGRQ